MNIHPLRNRHTPNALLPLLLALPLLLTNPAHAQDPDRPIGPQQNAEGKWEIRWVNAYTDPPIAVGDTLVDAIRAANRANKALGRAKDGKTSARADLRNALLFDSDLRGAQLWHADLGGANLKSADLSGANLSGANLAGSDLAGAVLILADLRSAKLGGADLSEAQLGGADLRGAFWRSANLSGAVFEPQTNPEIAPKTPKRLRPETFVYLASIAQAKGLRDLTYGDDPSAINMLRKEFKENGYLQQEREVTCAIQRRQYQDMTGLRAIEKAFRYVLFDLTCAYGASPWRPFLVLLALIPIFAFTYQYFLVRSTSGSKSYLWVTKNPDAEESFLARVRAVTPLPPLRRRKLFRRDFRIAIYFSLLSAFNIGFRDFNVGRWISRLQFRNYSMGGRGWVRTLSGLQALISVYLLAIWFLTYFYRPFG